MYVRVSEIKLLISFLRAIKSLYQKMHNKTEQNCTHYLSYATLVSYVAFVWAMLLKLPSSYIFGWFWALINTWHSWRIDNCKICQKYCFLSSNSRHSYSKQFRLSTVTWEQGGWESFGETAKYVWREKWPGHSRGGRENTMRDLHN